MGGRGEGQEAKEGLNLTKMNVGSLCLYLTLSRPRPLEYIDEETAEGDMICLRLGEKSKTIPHLKPFFMIAMSDFGLKYLYLQGVWFCCRHFFLCHMIIS